MLNKIYSLPEMHFVGGASEDFQFDLYRDEGRQKPLSLLGGSAHFAIVNFANKNGAPLVTKTMEICLNEAETYHNVVRVSLDPDDTIDLAGKFVYQITLRDADGNIDIPHQGVITIHNNIDKAFIKAGK